MRSDVSDCSGFDALLYRLPDPIQIQDDQDRNLQSARRRLRASQFVI